MLNLSDIPNPRTADAEIPASDRRAALERNAFPRQLGEADPHLRRNIT
jgi:hypothetical protein